MTEEEVTGIFDADFNQKFQTSVVMKADVNRPARVMRHPLENGSSIVDHIIYDPTEIELYLFFSGPDMRDGYAEVVQAFESGELLTVQTKVDSYESMVIDGVPHEETNDMIDGVALSIRMIEARFIEVEYTPVQRKASNTSTVKRGEQAPQPKQSILSRIFGK